MSSSTSPLELTELYATTTRHLLLRQFGPAYTSLSQLLASLPPPSLAADLSGSTASWDSSTTGGDDLTAQWRSIDPSTTKALKLSITILTSIYLHPHPYSLPLPHPILRLLSPISPTPSPLLHHLLHLLLTHLSPTPPPETLEIQELDITPTPPGLITTLLLASLKLSHPAATSFARDLVETYLAQIPDSTISEFLHPNPDAQNLAQSMESSTASLPPTAAKQGYRPDYLKLVELYVLEILPREGDWEVAKEVLNGEGVMGSKRKEHLFRRLRSLQSQQTKPAPTPSPPPPSSSRPSSTNSDSEESEMTARPGQVGLSQIKGKGRAGGGGGRVERLETPSASLLNVVAAAGEMGKKVGEKLADSLPEGRSEQEKKVVPTRSETGRTGFAGFRERLSGYLLPRPPRAVASGSPPVPQRGYSTMFLRVRENPISTLAILLSAMFALRRALLLRNQRREPAVVRGGSGAGQTTAGAELQARIRQKLLAQRGWRAWGRWWIVWWWGKVKEMVAMGMKITYV